MSRFFAVELFNLFIDEQKKGVVSYQSLKSKVLSSTETIYSFNDLTESGFSNNHASEVRGHSPHLPGIVLFIQQYAEPASVAPQIKITASYQQLLIISGLTEQDKYIQCNGGCRNTLLEQLISDFFDCFLQDQIVIFDPLYADVELLLNRTDFQAR